MVYTTAVLLYYEIPSETGLVNALIFTFVLFGLGFSMFFAIRYMDIGIKNLPELVIYHFILASLVTFLAIYLTGKIEEIFHSKDLLPSALVQGQAFIGILFYALIVMIFYLSNYQESLKEKQTKEDDLKRLLQEAELNLLKSQLNPHFIFNSLNSISSLTVTNPEMARDMVVKLSEFLRYALGKGEDEFVALEEELKNVSIFLDIEKTRFGDRLNIILDLDERANKIPVPVLILQPLVENAVKYSMYDTVAVANINLRTERMDSGIKISIENPYDPGDRSSRGKGIGLPNVKSRIRLLYLDKAELSVEKAGDVFRAILFLPY